MSLLENLKRRERKWKRGIAACRRFSYYILVVGLVGPTGVLAISLWFISYIKGEGESPFVLAQIAATFGGLVLVGSFVRRGRGGNQNNNLNKGILFVAKSFLVSAIGFVFLGMLFPETRGLEQESPNFNLMVGLNVASMLVAFGGFTVGISNLLLILPKLEIGSDADTES